MFYLHCQMQYAYEYQWLRIPSQESPAALKSLQASCRHLGGQEAGLGVCAFSLIQQGRSYRAEALELMGWSWHSLNLL